MTAAADKVSVLPTLLGLQPYEWLTLVGIVIGPIAAVLISLGFEARRRRRDQRLIILRLLMTTRHLAGDPGFSAAINLIPVEFAGNRDIQTAYKEFIISASTPTTDETRNQISQNTAVKQVKLVHAIARHMGFRIAETDIQAEAYAADAWRLRDNLLLDSQKAMRDIATTLHLQARLIVGAPLHANERQALGLPEQEQ